jgi:hypothetical protein
MPFEISAITRESERDEATKQKTGADVYVAKSAVQVVQDMKRNTGKREEQASLPKEENVHPSIKNKHA